MPDPQDTISIVLYLLLTAGLLIQLCYYVFLFSRLGFYKPQVQQAGVKPVSVIICARNESGNLRKFLHAVLEQSYPDFQVVVVNDCSWDDSEDLLKEFEKKYPALKVVTLVEQEKYQHGKKFAVSIGIKAAKHDLLLFTDADCMPAGNHWISNMQNHFHSGVDIVLGYGAYLKKKGFLNRLIRYDTFLVAQQYFSFALSGMTYMGTGRNLAYRKELFFKNKGFAKHYHMLSGDDDLFINEVAQRGNTEIEIQKTSFTYSEPMTAFGKWLTQKRRHMSTAHKYKFKHKFLLALFYASQFLFIAALILMIVLQAGWIIPAAAYGLRLLFQLVISGMGMKRLGELDLLWLLPFLDFFVTIIYPILAITNLFFKPRVWK